MVVNNMLFRSTVIGFFAILVIYPHLVGAEPFADNTQGVVVDEPQGADIDATEEMTDGAPQEAGVDATEEMTDGAPQEAEVDATEEMVDGTPQEAEVDATEEMVDGAPQEAEVDATEETLDGAPQEAEVDATEETLDGAPQEAEVDATEETVDGETQDANVDATEESAIDNTQGFAASPLQPKYVVNPDGSVTLRICYNWSCWYRETMTFTASDMELVKRRMATCQGTSLHDRLQHVRIGIWQMESLAQKYQPLLGNDRSINDFDKEAEGRMDCVDNSSNTTTYLHILRDIGELPGWTVSPPEVRKRLDVTAVHWTAVIIDTDSGVPWSIDSWFRPNSHLPMVMPLQSWLAEKKGWEPPFEQLNAVPQYINELCPQ